MSRTYAALLTGIVSAAMWVVVGSLLAAVVWFGLYRGDIVSLVLPQTIAPQYWQLPAPWPLLIPAASALAIGGLVWWAAQEILARAVGTRRSLVVLALWFVVVAAAAVVGAITGIGVLIGRGAPGSLSTLAEGLPDAIAAALYWGLVFGWIPAIVGTLGRSHVASEPGSGVRRLVPLVIALVAAVLLLVSVATVTTEARTAGLAGQAPTTVQQPAPSPVPTGTPPPVRAPGDYPIDPSWCISSELSFADLGGDAATGHREQSISVTNSGRDACVLPAYPDVAFADDHGVEVTAAVHDGSGFMTQDSGPAGLTLAPGEMAVTFLAWDATDGRTTIRDVWVAPYAGAERGLLVTENPMDITAATQVAVTAWARPAVSGP